MAYFTKTEYKCVQPQSLHFNQISVTTLNDLLIRQYNHDFPEKKYNDKEEQSVNDKQFLDIMESEVKFRDGHYYLHLPFKEAQCEMPNNRHLAEQRAMSLKRKFLRNQHFHQEYSAFLEDMIHRGYAEPVLQHQLRQENRKVWYIPHHGVYHPKRGKLCVVFDCSASFQEVSLNKELLQGPDLTNSLIGVLLRFHLEPVAFMADIESMYHRVKVQPSHVDNLCFLWWSAGDVLQGLKPYRMTVHLFGPTSSGSYALKQSAKDNSTDFSQEAVDKIRTNFYVDDCL